MLNFFKFSNTEFDCLAVIYNLQFLIMEKANQNKEHWLADSFFNLRREATRASVDQGLA